MLFVLFQFNFVGKLLGPKGNSLKRLQEDTMTKMAILGRGSMRDKHKVSYSNVHICAVICSGLQLLSRNLTRFKKLANGR
jgi:uncharacterized membrane protein YuzA (DUF378 family)